MSTSQQVALAFTAVLFTFVVLPRLFGVGVGSAGKENRFDSRYGRKGEDTSNGSGTQQYCCLNAIVACSVANSQRQGELDVQSSFFLDAAVCSCTDAVAIE